MAAPRGVLVDLDTIQKQIGWLKRYLQRNAMTSAHTLSALIESEMDTIDAAIQAQTQANALYADPTLSLNWDINPDPGIANSDGSAGADGATFTGKP